MAANIECQHKKNIHQTPSAKEFALGCYDWKMGEKFKRSQVVVQVVDRNNSTAWPAKTCLTGSL
jgi:hypothetical protein